MELGRRDFLKVSSGAAGLILLHPWSHVGKLSGATDRSEEIAMMVDVTKCVGCWWCYAACKQYNGLPEAARPDPNDPPELATDTWTTLFTEKKDRFRKQACMHCTDSGCVKVCPTGALYHDELGFVAYNRDKCSGCGYCVEACPFDVPQLAGNKVTGVSKMGKCTFCIDRVTNGQQPACAEACPTGAIKFGKRSDLLQECNERVDSIKADYPQATIYGDKELGGLHILYVLDDTPAAYGLPDDPQVPVAATLWQDVIQPVGWAVGGLVVAGLGLNYAVAKRKISDKSDGE
jgi:formate dehydrogenase iron-sulfur subunit